MTHDTVARMINRRGVETLHQLSTKYPRLTFLENSSIEWCLTCIGDTDVNTQFVRGRVFIDNHDGTLTWYTDIIGASYEEVIRSMKTLHVAAAQGVVQNSTPTIQ